MEPLQNLSNFQPDDWKFPFATSQAPGEWGLRYSRRGGNFSLRHSSADKSMPGLLSEMGKACFSKWHRERRLFDWLLSVSDDLILPARNSRFRRGLSPWWMWNLSGFLNYLTRLPKGTFARSFGRHRKVKKFDDRIRKFLCSRGIYFAKDTCPDILKVFGRDAPLEV